jgi:26S proteasome regulatory subunit N12
MAPQHLVALYNRLQRAFDAQASDLKTCGTLLSQLKVVEILFSGTFEN